MDNVLDAHITVLKKNQASEQQGDWNVVGKKKENKPD